MEQVAFSCPQDPAEPFAGLCGAGGGARPGGLGDRASDASGEGVELGAIGSDSPVPGGFE